MTAFAALDQLGAFVGLLVAAWWAGPTFPHDDDGVEIPLRRLHERQMWAYRIDPGLTSLQDCDGAR